MRTFVVTVLIALVAAPIISQAPSDLPIRRIMLYKHGVGYFERSGATASGAEIVLEFKASEMNDVLKSLTLLDRSGGRVSGVSYESSDPIAKQLENFGFNVPPNAGMSEVMDQFKGARVVVKTQSGEVKGSILGARKIANDKSEIEMLTLLLDGGQIKSVPVTESTELKLEDPRAQRDLANYLSVIANGHRRDLRLLRIRPGTARDLTVGYVVEAPVWKSSYRLVFEKAENKALLQGWAMVDNPSNEDWKDVELSLVSGLPISFTQNLYAPHYMNRPNVALPYEGAVAPRVYEGAMIFDKAVADLPVNGRMAGRGGGVGTTLNMYAGAAAAPPVRFSSTSEAMASTAEPATQGMELGDLFEYRVEKRMDIPRHESAMIPFVQTSVKAERVLLLDVSSGRSNPFDAVLLTNTSKLTLDGGAITVLDGDRYLGEALIENLKPGDSRPVSFAVDLGTRSTTAFDSRTDQAITVKVHRGVITTTSKNVETKTYTLRSTDDKPRTLILQHPVRSGWKLAAGGPKPEETTAQNYRFRMTLPPKESAKLTVTEEMEYPQTVQLNTLNSDMIALYVRGKSISDEARQKLQEVVALKDRIAATTKRISGKQDEISELTRDQERLRQNIQNLRNLPGQEAQVNSYAAKLAGQEKTIEAAQAALAAERGNLRQQQQQLDQMIATIEI